MDLKPRCIAGSWALAGARGCSGAGIDLVPFPVSRLPASAADWKQMPWRRELLDRDGRRLVRQPSTRTGWFPQSFYGRPCRAQSPPLGHRHGRDRRHCSARRRRLDWNRRIRTRAFSRLNDWLDKRGELGFTDLMPWIWAACIGTLAPQLCAAGAAGVGGVLDTGAGGCAGGRGNRRAGCGASPAAGDLPTLCDERGSAAARSYSWDQARLK